MSTDLLKRVGTGVVGRSSNMASASVFSSCSLSFHCAQARGRRDTRGDA